MKSSSSGGLNGFYMPAGEPFLPRLAEWVLSRYGTRPESLSRALVLLPSRRACRELQRVFLDAAGGRPLLLPRMRPIGDLDGGDLPMDLIQDILLLDAPPAMAPERRLLTLTRLVSRFAKASGDEGSARHSVHLAGALANLLDEFIREDVDITKIVDLVPADLAAHWQRTLAFLQIVLRQWPDALAQDGMIDAAARQHAMFHAVCDRWRAAPPAYPVIAAGSTGTQPAVAALLSTIARLPSGAVILSAIDREMPQAEWDALGPTHPQFALKRLLERMGCGRADIRPLVSLPSEPVRARALRRVFAPPPATARWAGEDPALMQGLEDIRMVAAESELDEARLIAAELRRVLDTPGKTAALVTPDRRLARMVAAQMRRFGVEIDDSAGVPFADTPPGGLLRLAMLMVSPSATPVDILAALRHPLAAAGRMRAELRHMSRVLELAIRRHGRPLSGLTACVGIAVDDAALQAWLSEMVTCAPLALFAEAREQPFSVLLRAHIEWVEWLTSGDEDASPWSGDAGAQLAEHLARVQAHADALGDIDPADYAVLFDALLAQSVYRPRFGTHPRLHILSPIEARLLAFDYLILGGLSEGVWPATPDPDPWMSRAMRVAVGLTVPERTIGQAAHDGFSLLAAAPQALLTRSRKQGGAPVVASRWWVRLETLCRGLNPGLFGAMTDLSASQAVLEALGAPVVMRAIERPAPVPPVSERPKRVSVSAVDRFHRDPYVFYARHVLRLHPLDPLEPEAGAAEFGSWVHDAIHRFCVLYPGELPPDALGVLRRLGDEALPPDGVRSIWQPRFEGIAAWFLEQEQARRRGGVTVIAEREGIIPIATPDGVFTVTARIDRIERSPSGEITIADYKTGGLPSRRQIESGDACQLPVAGLIVSQGVLSPALEYAVGAIDRLEYWKLSGRKESCEVVALQNPETLMERSREALESMAAAVMGLKAGFPAQTDLARLLDYNDYEHLTRRQEWGEGA